jgi:hypothetical protein
LKDTAKVDWGIECAVLMAAMESMHGCQISVLLITEPVGSSNYLKVIAEAKRMQPPGVLVSGVQASTAVVTTYPRNDAKDLCIALFQVLHRLDAQCGREFWSQSSLDGTATE